MSLLDRLFPPDQCDHDPDEHYQRLRAPQTWAEHEARARREAAHERRNLP